MPVRLEPAAPWSQEWKFYTGITVVTINEPVSQCPSWQVCVYSEGSDQNLSFLPEEMLDPWQPIK